MLFSTKKPKSNLLHFFYTLALRYKNAVSMLDIRLHTFCTKTCYIHLKLDLLTVQHSIQTICKYVHANTVMEISTMLGKQFWHYHYIKTIHSWPVHAIFSLAGTSSSDIITEYKTIHSIPSFLLCELFFSPSQTYNSMLSVTKPLPLMEWCLL